MYNLLTRLATAIMNPIREFIIRFIVPIVLAAMFILSLFVCGCSTTKAERIVTIYNAADEEIGREETTLELSRLDSEACIDGDCIRTKNASLFDRLWALPQLVLFQMGAGDPDS